MYKETRQKGYVWNHRNAQYELKTLPTERRQNDVCNHCQQTSIKAVSTRDILLHKL